MFVARYFTLLMCLDVVNTITKIMVHVYHESVNLIESWHEIPCRRPLVVLIKSIAMDEIMSFPAPIHTVMS